MKENSQEKSPQRTLEGGLAVISEDISESEDDIVFEFSLNRPTQMSELSSLWTPGSGNDVILERLIRKGWVAPDHSTLIHFKMDVAAAENDSKWKFRYYKAVPGPETIH